MLLSSTSQEEYKLYKHSRYCNENITKRWILSWRKRCCTELHSQLEHETLSNEDRLGLDKPPGDHMITLSTKHSFLLARPLHGQILVFHMPGAVQLISNMPP